MSTPPLFHLRQGDGPLVVSIPHAGTYIPPGIEAALTPIGRAVIDTDWHVDKLYDFVLETDATLLVATHSRTAVDLNRPPDGEKLYPGQAETGFCPTETFAGDPLYATTPPDEFARVNRLQTYWEPYHAALKKALAYAKSRHGYARLLDAHSIRTRIPRLFEGALPHLNFGTNNGAACTASVADQVLKAGRDERFTQILNGRFKGGYITRHYGNPADGIDAVQLELAQSAYMDDESPIPPAPTFDPDRAAPLIKILRRMVAELSRH